MTKTRQGSLPISLVRNRGLFANHWFERRLQLEPEWEQARPGARQSLDKLAELWKREEKRVERYGAEATLEQKFIQPVFEALGWKLIYQTYLQGREPDYALFLDDESLDAALRFDRTAPDFWKHPTVVADAKAWDVPLNRPTVVRSQREYPPQQIEWYVDRSRLDFGILTNGGLWRLVPREYAAHQRRFQTYLECDLAKLLQSWRTARTITERESVTDEFLEFYLLFGPTGYRRTDHLKPLIGRAIEGSSEYQVGVGEGLKGRAFEALRLCIEGFLNWEQNELVPAMDLERCRLESFFFLYRILFIMYAEDRDLLPYRRSRLYADNRSLRRHRDEIAGRLDRIGCGLEEDFSRATTAIWEDLQGLFDLIDRGHRRYGVPAYNGGLFDADTRPFLTEKRISDYYLARLIDQLGRAPDPLHPTAGLFPVDYRDLAIQHLGSIYEGLLELHPAHAREKMVVIWRRVQQRIVEDYCPASGPIPQGWQRTDQVYRQGSIYLKTERGERRASGSYYTPDHIVNYIVENTIVPACKAVSRQLEQEITAEEGLLKDASDEGRRQHEDRLRELRSGFGERLLRLKILDPAMGSGHFLIRACQRLAEEITTNPYTGDIVAVPEDHSAVSYWKRRVADSCLYGVDLNPLAVELAKLALWLETVAEDEPLSFLDHHLRHGNSLVGGRVAKMGVLPGELEYHADHFGSQIEDKLPAFLQPLTQIAEIPSDIAEHVKQKDRLYREFERAREPFRLVGDLWCSGFCRDAGITPERYQEAVSELGKPQRFANLTREPSFQAALARVREEFVRCFHWELEFPDVFLGGTRRRENPGFDVVLGNPPYDVLSELETQRDLAGFRAFIEADPTYAPSRRGKNNLYKLFICRALELLRDGGYLGFITPMTILGDDQAAEIRRRIVDVGSFAAIDAFPQKDSPALRVFPEAKLSTAVFTVVREAAALRGSRSFVCRIHPERWIEDGSPSLTLTTSSIPQYDPSNFTIVSCSQDDWDQAVRIVRTGRMGRLRDYAEFFQGEVNETNERQRGNLTDDQHKGKLVTRGACVCLYGFAPSSTSSQPCISASQVRAVAPSCRRELLENGWRFTYGYDARRSTLTRRSPPSGP